MISILCFLAVCVSSPVQQSAAGPWVANLWSVKGTVKWVRPDKSVHILHSAGDRPKLVPGDKFMVSAGSLLGVKYLGSDPEFLGPTGRWEWIGRRASGGGNARQQRVQKILDRFGTAANERGLGVQLCSPLDHENVPAEGFRVSRSSRDSGEEWVVDVVAGDDRVKIRITMPKGERFSQPIAIKQAPTSPTELSLSIRGHVADGLTFYVLSAKDEHDMAQELEAIRERDLVLRELQVAQVYRKYRCLSLMRDCLVRAAAMDTSLSALRAKAIQAAKGMNDPDAAWALDSGRL